MEHRAGPGDESAAEKILNRGLVLSQIDRARAHESASPVDRWCLSRRWRGSATAPPWTVTAASAHGGAAVFRWENRSASGSRYAGAEAHRHRDLGCRRRANSKQRPVDVLDSLVTKSLFRRALRSVDPGVK